MLSDGGKENGEKKTTIGLISKKATLILHVQHTFFVHFFAVVLHEYKVKLPETSQLHFFWRKCRTCSRSPFFHCPLFLPCIGGCQHFSCRHRRYKIFMLFFKKKMSPFFQLSDLSLQISVALFFVELRWPAADFLFFSVFLLLCIPNLWT